MKNIKEVQKIRDGLISWLKANWPAGVEYVRIVFHKNQQGVTDLAIEVGESTAITWPAKYEDVDLVVVKKKKS